MTDPRDCVRATIQALNEREIAHMLTGSLASNSYGRRQKDIEDVRHVLLVSGDGLDWLYLRQWCDQHGSRELRESLWEKARHDR